LFVICINNASFLDIALCKLTGKLTWRVLMTQIFGKPRNDFETPEKERSKEKALRSSDLLNEAATRQKKQK